MVLPKEERKYHAAHEKVSDIISKHGCLNSLKQGYNLYRKTQKKTYKEAFEYFKKMIYHKRRIRVYQEKCGMKESKNVAAYKKSCQRVSHIISSYKSLDVLKQQSSKYRRKEANKDNVYHKAYHNYHNYINNLEKIRQYEKNNKLNVQQQYQLPPSFASTINKTTRSSISLQHVSKSSYGVGSCIVDISIPEMSEYQVDKDQSHGIVPYCRLLYCRYIYTC